MAVNNHRLPKTVSTRIENDLHQELVDRCNKVGCRVSDFVKASIELALHDYVKFDFGGEDEEEKPAPLVETSKTQEPEPSVGRIRLVEND
jgi:hypothetical protein